MKEVVNVIWNILIDNLFNVGYLEERDFVFISVYVCIVGVFGFIGNLWVIVVFCWYKNLWILMNIFIVYFVGCDLFLVLMDLIFLFFFFVEYCWLFGKVVCEIFGFVYYFLNVMFLNMLVVILFDCFWVIMKFWFGVKIIVNWVVFCVFLIYFYILFFMLLIILGWIGFYEEIYFVGCYLNFEERDMRIFVYFIVMVVFLFFVLFVIMIYCYCFIFVLVCKWGKRNICLKWN